MSESLFALQKAIVAALNADAALVALLGGAKAFEHAPSSTSAPWIAFGDMKTRDLAASGPPLSEHRVTLVCVSRQPGTKEALTIAARVSALLQDAPLALAGHRLVSLAVTGVELAREGKEPVRKARVALRAVAEPI